MAVTIQLKKGAARDGDFRFLDYTGMFEVEPRVNKLVTQMNIFEPFFATSTVCEVERIDNKQAAIQTSQRGGERNKLTSEDARVELFKVPFFTLDRNIKPQDVQNFREYGTENAPKTVEASVARTMRAIRNSYDELRERAFINAIKGVSYAPLDLNSTYDYYTKWGQTQTTADVDFTDPAIDPSAVLEAQGRAHIIDNAGDQAGEYEVVMLCTRTYFSALIAHPLVVGAYQNYSSAQEPLRERLNGDSINRKFDHKGILFIEDISGYLDADTALMFPMGMYRMFEVHYAPSDTIAGANEQAQEAYVWYEEERRSATLESETSMLAVCNRPELVVKSTATLA